MQQKTVKNLIKLNIIIAIITVIEVFYVISNFKLYLENVLSIDIISLILGMSFAITMFLWVVGITGKQSS
ncbi:MAG: hypothetical protein QXZ44_03585 [Ferroplasma sp.]